MGWNGSAVIVRRQCEQSLVGRRCRPSDPPTRPAAAERQVRSYSGQPPEDLGNVRYRRPPTFAGQIRTTATSLKRHYPPHSHMTFWAFPREFSAQCLRTATLNEGA